MDYSINQCMLGLRWYSILYFCGLTNLETMLIYYSQLHDTTAPTKILLFKKRSRSKLIFGNVE